MQQGQGLPQTHGDPTGDPTAWMATATPGEAPLPALPGEPPAPAPPAQGTPLPKPLCPQALTVSLLENLLEM